jgi:hypothetical protein
MPAVDFKKIAIFIIELIKNQDRFSGRKFAVTPMGKQGGRYFVSLTPCRGGLGWGKSTIAVLRKRICGNAKNLPWASVIAVRIF